MVLLRAGKSGNVTVDVRTVDLSAFLFRTVRLCACLSASLFIRDLLTVRRLAVQVSPDSLVLCKMDIEGMQLCCCRLAF
jgi:hypothetical protein